MIGRGSALCDVILLACLLSLGAVFINRYTDVTVQRRNFRSRDFRLPSIFTSDEESPDEYVPSTPSVAFPDDGAVSQQTIDELLRRIPDTRPSVCRQRNHHQLPRASVVIVFSDYEFYDAKLTLSSMMRDEDLHQLVTEVLLVDDASNHDEVLRDIENYIRFVSSSFPAVRLVRLRVRGGRERARSLAVAHHVTSDVVVFVDAGVICMRGWLSPLLEQMDGATDGLATIAVPHYDHLTHPVTLEYAETDRDLVTTLSWSLSIRMRRHQNNDSSDGGLSRTVPVLRGEVFAVRRTFLSSIGGLYDSQLEDGSGAGQHVELSLRTWLCGGSIKVSSLLHFMRNNNK